MVDTMRRVAGVAVLAAVLGGGRLQAGFYDYADPTQVNLFHQVNAGVTGNVVTGAWVGATAGTAGSGAAGAFNRAGTYEPNVNWSAGDDNAEISYQVTLPQNRHLQDFRYYINDGNAGERPQFYRVRASTAGFGALETVVDWTPFSAASATIPLNATARYVSFDLRGHSDWNITRFGEFEAHAGPGDSYSILDGFNLFSQRSTATIDSHSANWTWDHPSVAINLNLLEAGLRPPPGSPSWFIVDLGTSYLLRGTALGLSSAWPSGLSIEVSQDKSSWVTAYSAASLSGYTVTPFPQVFDARYVRMNIPAGNGGSINEFELYAVPEPASLGLLLLGAAAFRRRRRV